MHDEVPAEDACFGAFARLAIEPQPDHRVRQSMGEEQAIRRETVPDHGFCCGGVAGENDEGRARRLRASIAVEVRSPLPILFQAGHTGAKTDLASELPDPGRQVLAHLPTAVREIVEAPGIPAHERVKAQESQETRQRDPSRIGGQTVARQAEEQ